MDELRNILCERRIYTNSCLSHAHSFGQLLLPLQGTLFIETNLHRVRLDNKHLFFLPPGDNHTFYSKDKNEFLVLDIPASLLPEQNYKNMDGGVYLPLDQRWESLRFLFLSETGAHSKPNPSLHDLFRYASRLLYNFDQPVSIQYVQNHYQEKISLEYLAALEHYNPSYYCQWFQKKTGLSPLAFIQKLRLEKAKYLLINTDFSLLRIAQEVGYEQQSSLARLFRQKEGMSASDYRKAFQR
ncbi:transcriptional regulator, AraC family [Desulforamulus reducens MI-1]|uniref:Transcriptional regulator, AraC family n=1 Tax=Desulforamulus reducens (strain ATCC BAA-1160 / DSM 100696 / MI-1) TaxID=349161 RepID=A4J4N3_DESRM|nr:AraC family transcriptional regulator [Desulforamulus reducens]ABO50036.1 transcriptional regulator, AraC family [Desulforamulus reducens MI-1]